MWRKRVVGSSSIFAGEGKKRERERVAAERAKEEAGEEKGRRGKRRRRRWMLAEERGEVAVGKSRGREEAGKGRGVGPVAAVSGNGRGVELSKLC